jgi:MFS family permease
VLPAEGSAARPDLRPLITAIAATALSGAGLSLSIPLIALRMEQAGYSGEANGLGIAISGVATLAFAPLVPACAARIGMCGLMLACVGASILSLAAFAATSNLDWWYPIRAVYSCALTGLFVASEFAINAVAPPKRRGLWIGIYSSCLAIGFAAGPAILGLVGTMGAAPFVAGIVLFAAASLPIAAYGGTLPVIDRHGRSSTLVFFRANPGLLSCAFVFGAIETGSMGLLPVYALRNGLSAEQGALFVAALAVGNAIFQIPLGLVSDRVSRRRLLIVVAATSFLGSLALVVLGGSVLFIPVLTVWGGLASGLYMVGLAELGARYTGGDLAAANAAFIVAYATGMLVGPPFIGRAVDFSASYGLFGALAAITGLLLVVLVSRARKR